MEMGPRSNGRLGVSLAVMLVLAVLAWRTLEPGRMQQVTWLLLGFFAFRIVMTRLRARYSSEGVVAELDDQTRDEADRRELSK